MHKHTLNKFFATLVVSVSLMFHAFGGGFQMNMQGLKATSMGGAFTGFASDASGVYYNPGAMTFQEYSQIALGATFNINSTSYLSPYTGNSNMDNKLQVPIHFYGIGKINEKTSFGISVNTPFNLHTTWEDDWTGRYITRETHLKALYLQPTIGFQLSDKFAVGGGPVIALGKTYITRAVPYSSASGEIGMELDGHSLGFGFNIGLFLQTSDEFSIGLDYRSAVKMNVKEGDANFTNVPSSLGDTYPSSTKFETEYTLPSVISLGAAYKLSRELTLCMDVNYTTWNSFDTLEFNFENESQLNFGIAKYYSNVFAVRIGAQYKISDRIDVRGGVAFDGSPVSDEYVSPDNPDNDRFIFSLGGTVRFGKQFSVDVAYMLQNIKEREVINEQYNFSGNYKSLVNIFGVTFNYQF